MPSPTRRLGKGERARFFRFCVTLWCRHKYQPRYSVYWTREWRTNCATFSAHIARQFEVFWSRSRPKLNRLILQSRFETRILFSVSESDSVQCMPAACSSGGQYGISEIPGGDEKSIKSVHTVVSRTIVFFIGNPLDRICTRRHTMRTHKMQFLRRRDAAHSGNREWNLFCTRHTASVCNCATILIWAHIWSSSLSLHVRSIERKIFARSIDRRRRCRFTTGQCAMRGAIFGRIAYMSQLDSNWPCSVRTAIVCTTFRGVACVCVCVTDRIKLSTELHCTWPSTPDSLGHGTGYDPYGVRYEHFQTVLCQT